MALPAQPPGVGAALFVRLLRQGHAWASVAEVSEAEWGTPDETGRCTPFLTVSLSAEAQARLSSFLSELRHTVLIVEPDPLEQQAFAEPLASEYRLLSVHSGAEALEALAHHEIGAVLMGQHVPDMSCEELVHKMASVQATVPRALLVAHGRGTSLALDALAAQGSVSYFLRRPFRPAELKQAVRRGVEDCALALDNERLNVELERVHERLERENRFLKRQVEASLRFEGLLGESAALKQALSELSRVRVTDTTVHLRGETGTGKELVARALHFSGPRATAPFLAVNCAGMTDSLLQSTLFGHRRGSFTGADRDHAGVFAEARGGTLFLDEVAELSPSVQGALLRALQEGEITPVGASDPLRVNVRVISATHADLRERVQAGQFREDLYFRLVVVSVGLPPLRARREDIRLLARHFLTLHQQHLGRRCGEPTEDFFRALEDYGWPGNVRELEHEMERLVVMAEEGAPLTSRVLSEHMVSPELPPSPVTPGGARRFIPVGASFDETVEAFMRERVKDALAQAQGSISGAAERLGVERSRLGKLRSRLGLGGLK